MGVDLKLLQAPFPASDIEWRAQRSGIKNGSGWVQVVAYIDNRAVMNRLDDVVGPDNWKDEYDTSPVGGVLCGISIKVDGEWITKWDGADKTDIEPIKGGLSNAEKRAAVKWGIGRYLYKLESEYVPVHNTGENYIGIKENRDDKFPKVKGYWNPPTLPSWARPIDLDAQQGKTEPAGPKMSSMITGTTTEADYPVEDPATTKHIIRIKNLYREVGADPEKRDAWLAQIRTRAQASQAEDQLMKKKAALADTEATE